MKEKKIKKGILPKPKRKFVIVVKEMKGQKPIKSKSFSYYDYKGTNTAEQIRDRLYKLM